MFGKLISAFFIGVAMTGCALGQGLRYDYDSDTTKASDAQGELKILNMEPRQLGFEFKNKAKSSSKILWDESVLVDIKGSPRKVIHQGVKYVDAGRSVPPSLVLSGGAIQDFVAYADGVRMIGNSWLEEQLVPCMQTGQMCSSDEFYGKNLTLLLTVETDGKKHEYQSKITLKPKVETK